MTESEILDGVVKDKLFEKVSFELGPNRMRRSQACNLGKEETAHAQAGRWEPAARVFCFPFPYSAHTYYFSVSGTLQSVKEIAL